MLYSSNYAPLHTELRMTSIRRIALLALTVGSVTLGARCFADESLPTAEVAPLLKNHPLASQCTVKGPSFEYRLSPVDVNADGVPQ